MLRPFPSRCAALTGGLVLVLAGCPAPAADAPAAAAEGAALARAMTLPIADSVALRLAAEATAQFDTSGPIVSGPRSCDPADPSQRSIRCQLALTARVDAGRLHPNAVPGTYAVLGAVRNTGDLSESRTGIGAGVTAYYLIEQGSGGRARSWYFSVDHGQNGAVVVISEGVYVACEHPHEGAKPLGAWRRCAEPDSTAAASGASAADPALPTWFPCGDVCCVGG